MNKKLVALMCSLAVVAVATVGFSAWVVGLQQTETTSGVNLTVDAVTNETQYLTASAENKTITIGENTIPESAGIITAKDLTNKSLGIAIDSNALKFSFDSIDVLLSNNVTSYKGVKIELDSSNNNFFVVNAEDNILSDQRTLGDEETFKYLDFDPVILSFASNFDKNTVTGGYTKYSLNSSSINNGEGTTNLSLKWGNFFGNKSPVTFYNQIDREGKGVDDLIKLIDNINDELGAMINALKGQTVTFRLSLVGGE